MLTANQNHLIGYFPKEDTLPKLMSDFQNPERDRFYENLVRNKNQTLSMSIKKETLQGPQVDFLPVFSPNQEGQIYTATHFRLQQRPRLIRE